MQVNLNNLASLPLQRRIAVPLGSSLAAQRDERRKRLPAFEDEA
jgi:hypothetical protein